MDNRKRPRPTPQNANGTPLSEWGEYSEADDIILLEPPAKRKVSLQHDEPPADDDNANSSMEITSEENDAFNEAATATAYNNEIYINGDSMDYECTSKSPLENIWANFAVFCDNFDLMQLRRVSKAFHRLIGPSFINIENFQALPSERYSIQYVLHQANLIGHLRKIADDKFASIPKSQWTNWVLPTNYTSIPDRLICYNASTLHISTLSLMNPKWLVAFENLHTITVDSLMAFSSFSQCQLPNIHTIVILNSPNRAEHDYYYQTLVKMSEKRHNPFRSNSFMTSFTSGNSPQCDTFLTELPSSSPITLSDTPVETESTQQAHLPVIDLSKPHNSTIFAKHFMELLDGGFVGLRRLSIAGLHAKELGMILEAVANREAVCDAFGYQHLTHLQLSCLNLTTPNSNMQSNGSSMEEEEMEEVADGSTLNESIFSCLPMLEEIWIDSPIQYHSEAEVLQLPMARKLQLTFADDPNMYTTINAPNLVFATLQLLGPSFVVFDTPMIHLKQLHFTAPIQSVSIILDSISSNSTSFPCLSTVHFRAQISQYSDSTNNIFSIEDIPSLTDLHCTFSAPDHEVSLGLNLNCSHLSSIYLDVSQTVNFQSLHLSPFLDNLEALHIGSQFYPRKSAECHVQISNWPPTIKHLSIPAHWVVVSETGPLLLTRVSDELAITTFTITSYELNFHSNLKQLSIAILSEWTNFFSLIEPILPQMNSLESLSLMVTSPEMFPSPNSRVTFSKLKSYSLQHLSVKYLPPQYCKSYQPTDVNRTETLRGKCKQCTCSGFASHASDVCLTPRCGHPSSAHEIANDSNARWLAITLECPQLRTLTLGGLHSVADISPLLRACPKLEHCNIMHSSMLSSVVLTHDNLRTLSLKNISGLESLHLTGFSLTKLAIENLPDLHSIYATPLPNLEDVFLVKTPHISYNMTRILQGCNSRGTVVCHKPPNPHWFPL